METLDSNGDVIIIESLNSNRPVPVKYPQIEDYWNGKPETYLNAWVIYYDDINRYMRAYPLPCPTVTPSPTTEGGYKPLPYWLEVLNSRQGRAVMQGLIVACIIILFIRLF